MYACLDCPRDQGPRFQSVEGKMAATGKRIVCFYRFDRGYRARFDT